MYCDAVGGGGGEADARAVRSGRRAGEGGGLHIVTHTRLCLRSGGLARHLQPDKSVHVGPAFLHSSVFGVGASTPSATD